MEGKNNNNNVPSVFSLSLYCSKTSPSRPVTLPPLSSSSPPHLLSSLVIIPRCTLVPAEFLQQEGTLPKNKLCENPCRLLVTIFTSPFTAHWFLCFSTSLLLVSFLLSSLLHLILKAQHSPSACTGGKKWWSKKEKRRGTVVSAPQKICHPPPIANWWQGGFLLSSSSANEQTVPGNTAVEPHRLMLVLC